VIRILLFIWRIKNEKRIFTITLLVLLRDAVPMTAQNTFFDLCKAGSPAQVTKTLKSG
jgi:hypothetical protein